MIEVNMGSSRNDWLVSAVQ